MGDKATSHWFHTAAGTAKVCADAWVLGSALISERGVGQRHSR